jgi:hypothetical protein
MFYVPALAFYYSGNVGEPSPHMRRVIKWVPGPRPWAVALQGVGWVL